MAVVRNNWTKQEIHDIYHQPLLELIFKAATIHREHHNSREVQFCTLLSIKTGGCPENCAYCPQSSHYKTGIAAEPLMSVASVLEKAKKAKESGSTRFCMGAAWRQVRDSKDFERVIEMIKGVNAIGMEVCVTLGMLTESQAKRLKEAGLFAYNHNLDTSKEHYQQIITTRTYEDRLDTLQKVREAGISVCCGGIIGLGETAEDRISLLHTLATQTFHPESVPINALVAIKGTPLENQKKIPIWDMLRMIGTARTIMPNAMVRLSAGRVSMSAAEQALCFLAGANSIFTGDVMLTTPNNEFNEDINLINTLGLLPREPFLQQPGWEAKVVRPSRPASELVR